MRIRKLTAVMAAALTAAALTAAALTALTACVSVPDETAADTVYESVTENMTESAEAAHEEYSREKRLVCNFFDRRDFDLYTAAAEDYGAKGELLCGTVPHHLTAGRMIGSFFKTAAASRPDTETVVIIATYHEPRENKIITSRLGWETPLGNVDCDTDITDRFIETGAAEDDRAVEYDHSAAAIIPFVKEYFPEAKAACLLVGRTADRDCPERIAAALAEVAADKKCLFVFSMDFSHYLPPHEADIRDGETIEAVSGREYGRIAAMNGSNDNVDSAYCLEAYVRLSDMLGGDITLLDRSNTMGIVGLPYNSANYPEGVTSYMVFGTEK